jgi:hypothetical protein
MFELYDVIFLQVIRHKHDLLFAHLALHHQFYQLKNSTIKVVFVVLRIA